MAHPYNRSANVYCGVDMLNIHLATIRLLLRHSVVVWSSTRTMLVSSLACKIPKLASILKVSLHPPLHPSGRLRLPLVPRPAQVVWVVWPIC